MITMCPLVPSPLICTYHDSLSILIENIILCSVNTEINCSECLFLLLFTCSFKKSIVCKERRILVNKGARLNSVVFGVWPSSGFGPHVAHNTFLFDPLQEGNSQRMRSHTYVYRLVQRRTEGVAPINQFGHCFHFQTLIKVRWKSIGYYLLKVLSLQSVRRDRLDIEFLYSKVLFLLLANACLLSTRTGPQGCATSTSA